MLFEVHKKMGHENNGRKTLTDQDTNEKTTLGRRLKEMDWNWGIGDVKGYI